MFNALPLPITIVILVAAVLLSYLTFKAVKNPSQDPFKVKFKGAVADLKFTLVQPFVKLKEKFKALGDKIKARVGAVKVAVTGTE